MSWRERVAQEWESKTAREKVFGLVEEYIGEYWRSGSGETPASQADKLIDAYRDELLAPVVEALREMDAETKRADYEGDAEGTWYYYRGGIEEALGLQAGALDTGDYAPESGDDE